QLASEAEKARAEALSAKQNEENQRKVVARSLALSVVQDAARLVDLGKKEQALTYLARALRLDESSLAARNWIFDLLVRGGFRPPAAPFARPQRQYGERILSAGFSPDGRRMVTAAWNGVAQVWDADTGSPVGAPMRHNGIVNFAAFSPDGR